MLDAILRYQFLQFALIASIFASIVCGIVGVIVVEKRLVMMSGGIAHTSYGGVGLGYLLGFEPILGAGLFAVLSSLAICFVNRKGGANKNTVIALLWSFCMALGILFIGFMKGYPPDMSSYLFGNILTVRKGDLIAMAVLTAVVALVMFGLYNDWKCYLFDSEFASVIGIKSRLLEYLLMVIIALTVVVFIRVVGIIMCIALLSCPAATAAFTTKKLGYRMLISIAISLLCSFVGLIISYYLNIASGATIILLSVTVYFIAFLINQISKRITLKSSKNVAKV